MKHNSKDKKEWLNIFSFDILNLWPIEHCMRENARKKIKYELKNTSLLRTVQQEVSIPE
jgi:hypothetical protein